MSTPSAVDTLSPATKLGRSVGPAAPHLFLALHCENPLAPASRHSLAQVEAVTIGRSTERSSERREEGGKRLLALAVQDPWMSGKHARLSRTPAGWLLEDAGSRNGTLVNGTLRQSALLSDGDTFELGHTFFVFREAVPVAGDRLDVDASQLEPAAPGLATLSGRLTSEFERLKLIAPAAVSVVIAGESGSGKELAARAIHQLSGRTGAFVPVNCGAIPGTLVETELFGYRRGAFTGASEDRPGLVRAADRGTLFLDEVADLPLPGQAALLRALQESEVLPVGGTKAIKVDLRLIAATHRDLKSLVQRGDFRADLYARIGGFTLTLPPLRGRREDLGIVLAAVLRKVAPDRCGRIQLSCEAARLLFRYGWPLNMRELEKSLSAAVALAPDGVIEPEHLPDDVRAEPASPAPAAPQPPTGQLSEEEVRRRDELAALMREHRGNIAAVARSLGKARMQVQRWLKRFGMDPASFR